MVKCSKSHGLILLSDGWPLDVLNVLAYDGSIMLTKKLLKAMSRNGKTKFPGRLKNSLIPYPVDI